MSYGDAFNGLSGGDGNTAYNTSNPSPLQQAILASQQSGGGGSASSPPYGLASPGSLSSLLGPVNSVGATQGLNQQILQGQSQNLSYQGLLAQLANQLQLGNLLGNYGLENTEAQTAAPNTIAQALASGTGFFGQLGSALNGLSSGLGNLLGGSSGLPGGMSSNSGAGFSFGAPTAAQQIASGAQATGQGGGAAVGASGGLPLAGSLNASQMGFSPTEASMVPSGALFAPQGWQGPTNAQRLGYLGGTASASMGAPQQATGTSNLTNLLSAMGLG